MTDWLERYLDVAALDGVMAALMAARPAFVVASDGSAVLAANPPGAALFRARSVPALLVRRLSEGSPLGQQIARLARILPADRPRRDVLTFPLMLVPAVCRLIHLADGDTAVLAIADAPASPETARARAEHLVATIAGGDRAAAIIDADAGVLAASGGFDERLGDEVGRLADDTSGRTQVSLGGGAADIIAFDVEGGRLRLVVTSSAPTEVLAETVVREEPPTAAAAPAPAAPPAPAEPPAPAAPPAIAAEAPSPPPLPSEPVASPIAERLSGVEADAFGRIREVLGKTDARLARLPDPSPAQPVVAQALPSVPETAPALHTPPSAPPPPVYDETLLDRVPLGIVVFRNGRTLFANRFLLDLLGLDSVAAFDAVGGVDALFADGTHAWAAGDFDDGDGRLAARRRDGTAVPVEARLNTVTYSGETALMLSVTPRAVPVEVEPPPPTPPPSPVPAPLSATAAERRILDLETILNTATDGVITVDRHGTIESMNRAAEALFAIDVGDFKGRSITELFAEESRKAALDYLDGLAANGVQSVLNDGREVIGRVPHGGLIPLTMTMGRLGESGRFCAVLRDITHWKTVEEELTSARREAEAANAQKSDFLAKISHEIRTPLNAIIGFSDIMMEQRFGPIANDRYRAYVRDIHVSGAHLMSLVNDLLDLSKIEAGKVDLTFESVALNAVILECVALMQPLANRERIIIRTSLGTEIPNVVADQRSFRQILLNLLSNAIKFTRAGGQVIVSTQLEDSGEVVVRVRDTGIGMTAKEVETAMKPFEQVAKSREDRDKGTGLGLPLTKAMVEANRAAFAIESAPNQGTLVRITFPTTRVLAG